MTVSITPRNYSFYRSGNSTIFFSYVCNDKKIRVVYLYLKCVRCVSSRPVVLKARLAANERRRWASKKPGYSDTFFWSGPQTLNSCRSLHYARGNKYIIFFNDLCKPIEIYIYARKKHPFTSYPAAKHQKQ